MHEKSHSAALALILAFATAAVANEESRPRIMHAEMVTLGNAKPAQAVKVADTAEAPAPRQRMFNVPQIDKSKAEDPFKNSPPPAAAASVPAAKAAAEPPAVSATKPAPPPPSRPVLKMPELSAAQELTRQQRELMLATSGPRKVARKKAEAVEKPTAPDLSNVHWGYLGPGAPENWGKLKAEYATCAKGKRQSPIDIRGGIRVDLDPIRFDYRPSHFSVIDNGHTVEAKVAEGSSITLTGRTYQLIQIHFHRPAEERVNGKLYEMSAHLVHKDFENNIAVIAVLLERGAEHPEIQTIWNHMPLEVGQVVSPPAAAIDLMKLLPEQREYYTYMGSLTTPPCTENVLWMVFKQPLKVSSEQIDIFARLYPNNARPIQPTHNRLIKESR